MENLYHFLALSMLVSGGCDSSSQYTIGKPMQFPINLYLLVLL